MGYSQQNSWKLHDKNHTIKAIEGRALLKQLSSFWKLKVIQRIIYKTQTVITSEVLIDKLAKHRQA